MTRDQASKRRIQNDRLVKAQLHQLLVLHHFDANDTAFLERELTQLRARLFEVQFPELISRMLMPFASDIAPSAETYSYKVLKPVGAAKFVGTSANDLPRVDAVAREVLGKVHPIGVSYGWDVNELREAARLNVPISDVKAKTARDAVERGIDEVLAVGDLSGSAQQSGLQLSGLTNNSDVIAQGIQSGSYWTNAQAATMLAELNALVRAPATATKNRFVANTLLLPTAHFYQAAQTPYSIVTGESILTVFKKNNDFVTTVRPWYRLDTAGAAGGPRAVAYLRDPMVLEGIVPQEFEQLPPEARGLEFVINCIARCGGVKIYQPTGMKYLDFATA